MGRPSARSVAHAYQFLNQDGSHPGRTAPRLAQSYRGGLGPDSDTSSAVYDDALVIDAYLAENPQNGWPGPRLS